MMRLPGTNQQEVRPLLEPTHPQPERQVGNYRLLRSLGQGTWGEVSLGEHCHSRRLRAIKLSHVPCSEQLQQRCVRTAQVLARLEHPHLVRLYDYGLHEDRLYLVMSYAPNGSLRDLASVGTPLALRRWLPLVSQLASALDHLHQQQVLHLALTPAQVLLGLQGQVQISDMGFASLFHSAEALPGNAQGTTLAYAAPELLRGQPCCCSDQYALAIMVYEWLTGTCPFAGTPGELAAQQALCPPPSLSQRAEDLPPQVEAVLFQALAKEPAQRYESVTAFVRALEAASCQTVTSSAKLTRPVLPARGPARLRALARRLFAREPVAHKGSRKRGALPWRRQ